MVGVLRQALPLLLEHSARIERQSFAFRESGGVERTWPPAEAVRGAADTLLQNLNGLVEQTLMARKIAWDLTVPTPEALPLYLKRAPLMVNLAKTLVPSLGTSRAANIMVGRTTGKDRIRDRNRAVKQLSAEGDTVRFAADVNKALSVKEASRLFRETAIKARHVRTAKAKRRV
jgi:hypothetical protein